MTYYGFPLVSYTLQYPCVGDRALVKRITEIVGDVEEDTERGYDHGVFIPLKLVIPKADIPVVQLSLHANLSSNLHFELGEKLSALREEGVLIIGSGFTTHNMELMMQDAGKEELKKFVEEARVCTLISDAALRKKKLLELEKSPNFRRAHPRADHWMPFVVAAGAAGDSEAEILYQQWWIVFYFKMNEFPGVPYLFLTRHQPNEINLFPVYLVRFKTLAYTARLVSIIQTGTPHLSVATGSLRENFGSWLLFDGTPKVEYILAPQTRLGSCTGQLLPACKGPPVIIIT